MSDSAKRPDIKCAVVVIAYGDRLEVVGETISMSADEIGDAVRGRLEAILRPSPPSDRATTPYSEIRFSDADGTGPAREMRRERAAQPWLYPNWAFSAPVAEQSAEDAHTEKCHDDALARLAELNAADATVSAELHTRAMEPVFPACMEGYREQMEYCGVYSDGTTLRWMWYHRNAATFVAVTINNPQEYIWLGKDPAERGWTLVKSP